MNNLPDFEQDQDLPEDVTYEHEENGNENDSPYGLFGLDISKIKIGRIDFTRDNHKDK